MKTFEIVKTCRKGPEKQVRLLCQKGRPRDERASRQDESRTLLVPTCQVALAPNAGGVRSSNGSHNSQREIRDAPPPSGTTILINHH